MSVRELMELLSGFPGDQELRIIVAGSRLSVTRLTRSGVNDRAIEKCWLDMGAVTGHELSRCEEELNRLVGDNTNDLGIVAMELNE